MGFVFPAPLLRRAPLDPKASRSVLPPVRQPATGPALPLALLARRLPDAGGEVVGPGDPGVGPSHGAEAPRAVPSPLQVPKRLVRFRLPASTSHSVRRRTTEAALRASASPAWRPSAVTRIWSTGSGSPPEQARSARCVWSRRGCSWIRPVRPHACYRIRGPASPGKGPGLVARLISDTTCSLGPMCCRSRRRQPWWPPRPAPTCPAPEGA
jgi:hypothetical protein